MTDAQPEPAPKPDLTPGAGGPHDPHHMPDSALRLLVDLANGGGLEIGITLHTAGLLISGTLISGQTYFAAVQAEVQLGSEQDSEGSRTVRDALGTLFESLAESYRDREQRRGAEDDDDVRRHDFESIAFIHLRGATVTAPGMTYNIDLWRARLIDVSGWRLGEFVAT